MFSILIFINPVSGNGKSFKIFKKAYELLQKNNLVDVHITKKETNITHLLELTHNIEQYNLIVGIGGDGIMFEIINALQNLELNIPIAQIPAGSGNGYFKSLTYQTKQEYSIETAIDIINRHNRYMFTDLLYITNNKKTKHYFSRLSISWGFISSVDIHTEWLRKIGSFRFTLGVLWNIYKKINYKGVLEYKNDNEWHTIKSDQFIYFWACNTSHPSYDTIIAPESKVDDGLIDISYIIGPISRCELLQLFVTMDTKHPKLRRIRTKEFRLTTENGLIVVDGEQIKEKEIDVTNLQKISKIIY